MTIVRCLILFLAMVILSSCAIGYAPGIKPTTIGRDNDNDSLVTGVRSDADLSTTYITHEFSFVDRKSAVKNFFRESFGKERSDENTDLEEYFVPPLRTELLLKIGTAGSLSVRRPNALTDIEITDYNSLYLSAKARHPIYVLALSDSGDLQFGIDAGFVWDGYLLSEDANVQGEVLIGKLYNRFDAEVGAGFGFLIRRTIMAETRASLALVNPLLNLVGGGLGDNDELPILDANLELALTWKPIARTFLSLRGGFGQGIVDGSRGYDDSFVQLGIRYTF